MRAGAAVLVLRAAARAAASAGAAAPAAGDGSVGLAVRQLPLQTLLRRARARPATGGSGTGGAMPGRMTGSCCICCGSGRGARGPVKGLAWAAPGSGPVRAAVGLGALQHVPQRLADPRPVRAAAAVRPAPGS